MFGIIDRYIIFEVLKAFVAIMCAVLLIVVSMLMLRTLEEVNVGALGSELILRYMGLQLLRGLPSLLPPVYFISVLVALGRMARDSELIALSSSGVGPARVYRSLFYFVLPIVLVTSWLSFTLKPQAVSEIHKIRQQGKDEVQQIAGIKQGRFYQHRLKGGEGQITVYVEKIEENKRLRNIFVHDRRKDQVRLVVSDTGLRRVDEATGEQFVTLLNGRRYDGSPGQPDYSIGTFERYNLRIEPSHLEYLRGGKRAAFRTGELLGSEDLADRAELQDRLGKPLAVITLTLLTIPLTAQSPRQRATGRMFLAFLTYFAFFNLQRLATSWFESGFTPAWLGSLWYQALVLGLVLVILMPGGHWPRRLLTRLKWRQAG